MGGGVIRQGQHRGICRVEALQGSRNLQGVRFQLLDGHRLGIRLAIDRQAERQRSQGQLAKQLPFGDPAVLAVDAR